MIALRTITFFITIALLLFVGLHAVVPHDHPHASGTFHGSEIPPVAHAENKIFILVLTALFLPILFDLISRMLLFVAQACTLLYFRERSTVEMIPIRYDEALRRGRIHSRAD